MIDNYLLFVSACTCWYVAWQLGFRSLPAESTSGLSQQETHYSSQTVSECPTTPEKKDLITKIILVNLVTVVV